MSSRKILDVLDKPLRCLNGFANFGLVDAAAVNTLSQAILAHLPFFVINTACPLLISIPFLGMALSSLKIINGLRSLSIYYTAKPSPKRNSCLEPRGLKEECYINGVLELISGAAFFGFFYEAFYPSTAFLSSIGFSYLGFSIRSLIDLVRAMDRMYRTYLEKDCSDTKNAIFKIAVTDFFVSLFKFVGWSLLACSNILGASSLAITLGWILIGAAAQLQLIRSLETAGSYVLGRLFSHPCRKTPIETETFKNKKEFEEIPGLPKKERLEEMSNAGRAFI